MITQDLGTQGSKITQATEAEMTKFWPSKKKRKKNKGPFLKGLT